MGLKDFLSGKTIIDSMSQKYVGSIIRAGLIAVGAVTARDVDDGQITQLAGAVMAIASVAWSMYEKRQTRNVTVTALALAGVSENHAKSLIADPDVQTPSVASPSSAVPCLPVAIQR